MIISLIKNKRIYKDLGIGKIKIICQPDDIHHPDEDCLDMWIAHYLFYSTVAFWEKILNLAPVAETAAQVDCTK